MRGINYMSIALDKVINFIIADAEANVGALCLLGLITFMTLGVWVALQQKMNSDSYANRKSWNDSHPNDDYCGPLLVACLTSVWMPAWNIPNYGVRKDCRTCWAVCDDTGSWPEDMCPWN
jgi:hypothetical protein